MNDNDVREIVAEKLAKMADSKTVTEVILAHLELKSVLRDYKNELKIRLTYGKETPENDN